MWLLASGLVLVVAWGLYTWHCFRAPTHGSIPALWRTMAYRHPDAADALRIRKAFGLATLKAHDPKLTALLPIVDSVVDAVALLAQARDPGAGPEDVSRAAVALLVELDHLQATDRLLTAASIPARLAASHRDLVHALTLRGLRETPP